MLTIRFQIKTLLNDIWATVREEIGEARNLNSKTLDEYYQQPTYCLSLKMLSNQTLIDALAYEDDFDESIKTALEISSSQKDPFGVNKYS